MEIKINIPANNYVQPTEIREEIVQKFCEHVIQYMDGPSYYENGYTINVRTYLYKPEVYLNFKESGVTCSITNCRATDLELRSGKSVKVRTVEMKAIFEVMQNAGYFIFGSENTSGVYSYNFNRRNYYNGRYATRTEFNIPID